MAAGEMNMPSSLAPYPEMIYAALDALNEQMGSNKTSISKFIESKYGNLPPGHSTLLRLHLNKMKESGELIFWKNNYMKPNPNFIRRGRGRPPKSSSKSPGSINGGGAGTPSAPSLVLGSGHVKPRGRPRKYSSDQHVYDAVTVPLADVDDDEDNGANGDGGGGAGERGFVVTKSGRGRGRPPKLPRVDDNGVAASSPSAGSGRPRGRPPKVKAQTVSGGAGYDVGSSEW